MLTRLVSKSWAEAILCEVQIHFTQPQNSFFFLFFFPPASEFLFLALAENQLDKYSLFLHGHFGSWQGNEVAIYSEYCLINSRNSTVYQVYCSFAHKKSHKTQNMNNLILMLLLTLLFNINNI